MGVVAAQRHGVDSLTIVRAVVDTSSLVQSALRRELQEAAAFETFVPLWSPWIVAELNRVLTWRWIKDPPPHITRNDLSNANEKRCADMAKRMMELLIPVFEVVTPRPPYPPAWATLTDRWDEPIWAAAKVGNAQYVVSENTHHYPPRGPDGRHRHEGIELYAGSDIPGYAHRRQRLGTPT